MGRAENVAVFEESMELCRRDPRLREAVEQTRKRTRLVPEGSPLPGHGGEDRIGERTRVEVSRHRSFEAAMGYADKRVCVLNFASATSPGGGVTRGASAQEECLCRVSTLYPCLNTRALWTGFYTPHRETGDPLHNDDCIYTPDIVVFREDTPEARLLPEEKRKTVDVLTCAAPNLRERPSNPMNPGDGRRPVSLAGDALRELHVKRLRRILDLAAEQGAEVLILGAFGCGAFANPPEVVAAAMRETLEEYDRVFHTVEFAVYCAPGREENLRAFRQAFRDWNGPQSE